MTFDEILSRVQELLQHEQRVSCRGLKRRFALDDEYEEDLKEELIGTKRLATDEDGRFLVWTGGSAVVSAQLPVVSPQPLPEVSSSKFQVADPRSLNLDPQGEAEAHFLKAIDIAQKQQAKSLELRVSTSLARLWQQQGKSAEAQQMLSEIYNWFTEHHFAENGYSPSLLPIALNRIT